MNLFNVFRIISIQMRFKLQADLTVWEMDRMVIVMRDGIQGYRCGKLSTVWSHGRLYSEAVRCEQQIFERMASH